MEIILGGVFWDKTVFYLMNKAGKLSTHICPSNKIKKGFQS